jgi:hypothetical protein
MGSYFCRIYRRSIDILAVQKYLPANACTWNEVVHAIEAAQESAFTASGWPNESRHLMAWHCEAYSSQGLKVSVPHIQVFNFDDV